MSSTKLFEPLKVGRMNLEHRLILAPLTRLRATDDHVILPMAAEYYGQRACVPGTLLISEATHVSPKAIGMPNAPGVFNKAQIDAWKPVTKAVHDKGSYIYCQLWGMGRAAKQHVLERYGMDMISSSAVPIDDKSPTPRELTEEEIQGLIKDYAQAAKNSIEAGFDGVEVHGANGYLPDQFLQDNCNKRTDKWGGSIENRARFHIEVTKAVVEAIGADRTGIRLSPWSRFQGMRMADPIPQFSYVIQELKKLNLAYLHVVESRVAGSTDIDSDGINDFAVKIWDNQSPLFLAGGFHPASAKHVVDNEHKDKDIGIVFGRFFISNPDLVFRIQKGLELQQYDRSTFYIPGEPKGYTDYPFSEEFKASNESRL